MSKKKEKAGQKAGAVPAGLAGDPAEFMVMTEISIIAHLAETLFARNLPDGMTVAQFGVLNHLLRLKRQETIGELARAHQVSQPTMSSTVRRLEDKGFVALVPDPEDRRIRRVRVTKAGEKARAAALGAAAPVSQEVLGRLAPEKWAALHPLLTELRVILDQTR
ncbi:MarR family winged helix-turn-helix transcriptional regulator [Tepidicaulis sp. LMO-SS28]|uniref:MarR family winged helix-turn-helix transcriptional regulator n=1 Tax=Tepidicaulis sp. LMO-SS28 TaxID=3447455 RepID=UPI003EE1DBE1